jgi:hypothetical protein
MTDSVAEIHSVLAAINSAWLEKHPSSMAEHLHPDITMAVPGFKESIRGREILLNSFEEFCKNATVLEYQETNEHIDVIEDSGIATFCFNMTYERAADREVSTGRDLWVFHRRFGRWVALWRAMIELTAERTAKN